MSQKNFHSFHQKKFLQKIFCPTKKKSSKQNRILIPGLKSKYFLTWKVTSKTNMFHLIKILHRSSFFRIKFILLISISLSSKVRLKPKLIWFSSRNSHSSSGVIHNIFCIRSDLRSRERKKRIKIPASHVNQEYFQSLTNNKNEPKYLFLYNLGLESTFSFQSKQCASGSVWERIFLLNLPRSPVKSF